MPPGLIAALIAITAALGAIPVTVVTGYIPPAVGAHKAIWFGGLAVLLIVLGALAVISARTAGPEPVAVPREPEPEPIVVGEIPREPPAFVDRATIGRLADAAESGRAAVLCAVTGLRGVGKTQVAAAYARSRVEAGWGLIAG